MIEKLKIPEEERKHITRTHRSLQRAIVRAYHNTKGPRSELFNLDISLQQKRWRHSIKYLALEDPAWGHEFLQDLSLKWVGKYWIDYGKMKPEVKEAVRRSLGLSDLTPLRSSEEIEETHDEEGQRTLFGVKEEDKTPSYFEGGM